MKRLTDKVFLLFISLVLVSCNSPAIETSVPAVLPVVKFTSTALPPSLTPTVVLTPTFAPAITLTPPATLSLEESNREIRQLLQNDVACKPPCFLGVVPEQTSLGELKNILQRFGLSPTVYQDIVYNIYQHPDSDIPPHTQFFIQNEIVNSIKLDIDQVNEFEWSLYSPASILQRFGAPSFVMFWLQVVHEPTPTPWKAWYVMTFYYDDLDFIIEYGFPEVTLGEVITVCPNKDTFEYTRLWLGKYPDHAPSRLQDGSLEQVSSFTLKSFRDYLLLGPGACFYLNGKAVPIL